MIRYSRDNRKYSVKKSTNWITITGYEPILVNANTDKIVDTGLKFWFDGGSIALLMEASLPPVLRIVNRTLAGRTNLLIQLYNTSDNDVLLPIPIEICYVLPLATAYFNNIELEEVNSIWLAPDQSIAEI